MRSVATAVPVWWSGFRVHEGHGPEANVFDFGAGGPRTPVAEHEQKWRQLARQLRTGGGARAGAAHDTVAPGTPRSMPSTRNGSNSCGPKTGSAFIWDATSEASSSAFEVWFRRSAGPPAAGCQSRLVHDDLHRRSARTAAGRDVAQPRAAARDVLDGAHLPVHFDGIADENWSRSG